MVRIEQLSITENKIFFSGVGTAKNASEQLDIHMLDALNQMLNKQPDGAITPGQPVRSSQLDLNQLRSVIKQTYYELDKDLRKMIKDESGCVCVGVIDYTNFKEKYFSII
jgi:hypothetical protein